MPSINCSAYSGRLSRATVDLHGSFSLTLEFGGDYVQVPGLSRDELMMIHEAVAATLDGLAPVDLAALSGLHPRDCDGGLAHTGAMCPACCGSGRLPHGSTGGVPLVP